MEDLMIEVMKELGELCKYKYDGINNDEGVQLVDKKFARIHSMYQKYFEKAYMKGFEDGQKVGK